MFFGRILGALIGYAASGWLTAILGFFIGLYFDRGFKRAQQQVDPTKRAVIEQAFFRAVFSLMGRLSKCDGRISEAEIAGTEQLMKRMELNESARQEAIRLFKEGADETYDVVAAVESFIQVCGSYGNLKQIFLVYLITIAYADGELHSEEENLLAFLASKLGYSSFAFNHLLGMVRAQNHFYRSQYRQENASGSDGARADGSESGYGRGRYQRENQYQRESQNELALAYQALGVSESATDAEIKKAYRKLMSEYHPDKLTGRGVPDELIKVATERSQEIQAAYELVKKNRDK